MHEIGIASSVLDAVRAERARYPGGRVCKVGVKVGELGGVDCDALRFCFDALTRDTDLDGLELEIEYCPLRHRCPACDETFAVEQFETRCPRCGRLDTEFAGGDELDLAYLEVDVDGSGTPRTQGAQ
ncbi:MAG TPA: hydrogenase maturation nickel metallochaperone HypA [Vicinamibacterales bacterium]|nr:hydrogenase maturation nickel metallochaperone HypA [Vicinamibacterales bacterium]